MKYIELPREKKGLLRRIFKVSGVTVWAALNYQTNSDLANRIRAVALEAGGVVKNTLSIPDGFMPNCQTDYVLGTDSCIQRTIQTFSNGVRVEFDNDVCTATIFHKDKNIKTYKNVAIRDWGNIVFEAQNLSDSLNS